MHNGPEAQASTYYINDKGGFLSCLLDARKTNDTEKTLLTFQPELCKISFFWECVNGYWNYGAYAYGYCWG